MKKYRLLRNNKESGPFSAAEIIQMGLKAYDLIWVDGKSAAWRYPGEMEEFKAYAPLIEEQPFDRFFKKGEAVQTNSAGGGIATMVTPTEATMVKQKPRIRIRAEWSRIGQDTSATQVVYRQPEIQTPVQSQVLPQMEQAQVNKATPSWESSWLDWQQEKKAVKQAAQTSDANDVAAATAYKAAIVANEPVLETKFSQSLNDIKERYTATVLKAKTKTVEWQKFKGIAIMALLAIPVLCFGIWVGHKWTGGDVETSAQKSVIPAAKVAAVLQTEPAADNSSNNVQPVDEKKQGAQDKSSGKEIIPSFDENNDKPQIKQNTHNTEQLGKTHFVPVVPNNSIVKNQSTPAAKYTKPVQQQRYALTQPDRLDPGARTKTINPNLLPNANANSSYNKQENNQQVSARKNDDDNSPIFKHISKKEKIEDFVTIDPEQSSFQTVQGLKLNVQNVADIRLDLVVLDIQYFDANNRFRMGQTIYVKNIPSGENVDVKVPDNPSATKIKYKISLVSAEQKGIYLIGE